MPVDLLLHVVAHLIKYLLMDKWPSLINDQSKLWEVWVVKGEGKVIMS